MKRIGARAGNHQLIIDNSSTPCPTPLASLYNDVLAAPPPLRKRKKKKAGERERGIILFFFIVNGLQIFQYTYICGEKKRKAALEFDFFFFCLIHRPPPTPIPRVLFIKLEKKNFKI